MSDDYGTHIEDDGSPQIIVVDGEDQGLWVRVGPIFTGDDDNPIDAAPGVWIDYQDTYMGSKLEGPVLIPIDVWDHLDTWVRARAAKFDKGGYAPRSDI